jgi:hypothetical protein
MDEQEPMNDEEAMNDEDDEIPEEILSTPVNVSCIRMVPL